MFWCLFQWILWEWWWFKVWVKDRQQTSPYLALCSSSSKVRDKSNNKHNILRYMAIHESYSNTFFMQVGYVALANMFPWVVEKWNISRNKAIFPISHLSNLEFWKFSQAKDSSLYTPQMALSNHSMVYISLPRHSKVLPSFVFSYF